MLLAVRWYVCCYSMARPLDFLLVLPIIHIAAYFYAPAYARPFFLSSTQRTNTHQRYVGRKTGMAYTMQMKHTLTSTYAYHAKSFYRTAAYMQPRRRPSIYASAYRRSRPYVDGCPDIRLLFDSTASSLSMIYPANINNWRQGDVKA